jgi:hypothetical protein
MASSDEYAQFGFNIKWLNQEILISNWYGRNGDCSSMKLPVVQMLLLLFFAQVSSQGSRRSPAVVQPVAYNAVQQEENWDEDVIEVTNTSQFGRYIPSVKLGRGQCIDLSLNQPAVSHKYQSRIIR